MRLRVALRVQQTVYATSTKIRTHITHTQAGKHTLSHTQSITHSHSKQLFMLHASFAARLIQIPQNPQIPKLFFSMSKSMSMCRSVAADVRLQLQLPTDCAAVCLWRFLAACCCHAVLLARCLVLLVPPPRVVNSMWKLKLTTTDVGHAAEGSQQAAESSRQAAAAAATAAGSKQCCRRQLQPQQLLRCAESLVVVVVVKENCYNFRPISL